MALLEETDHTLCHEAYVAGWMGTSDQVQRMWIG
jgi:hypothetical protein